MRLGTADRSATRPAAAAPPVHPTVSPRVLSLARFNCNLFLTTTLYSSTRAGHAYKPDTMPIFSKTPKGKTALSDESSWEDWKAWQEEYRRTPTMSQDTSRRGILRNSVDPSPRGTPAARTSDPAASSPAFDTAQEGRSRFNSMPTSAKEKNVSGSTARFPVHHSPSLSQLSDRARDLAPPRTSDAEADRLARACGDGPFSPTSPSPFFETSAFVGTAGARSRSQSASTPRGRRSSAAQIRPAPRLQPFPHPTKPHAVRALTRILNEDTKTFKLHDYIEVEDLMSGRLWEDEDELPVDCVRDKAEDDSGHDGVWRRERRERRLMSGVNRAIRQRDGSTFISHLVTNVTDTSRQVYSGHTSKISRKLL